MVTLKQPRVADYAAILAAKLPDAAVDAGLRGPRCSPTISRFLAEARDHNTRTSASDPDSRVRVNSIAHRADTLRVSANSLLLSRRGGVHAAQRAARRGAHRGPRHRTVGDGERERESARATARAHVFDYQRSSTRLGSH